MVEKEICVLSSCFDLQGREHVRIWLFILFIIEKELHARIIYLNELHGKEKDYASLIEKPIIVDGSHKFRQKR